MFHHIDRPFGESHTFPSTNADDTGAQDQRMRRCQGESLAGIFGARIFVHEDDGCPLVMRCGTSVHIVVVGRDVDQPATRS